MASQATLTGTQEPTGSQTITVDPTSSQSVTPITSDNEERFAGTIRLEGATISNRRVRWDDNVVDNEGLGKKKSKICCIYSKPRAFGESDSDESDTESDSETDSDLSDDGKIRSAKRRAAPNAYEKASYSKKAQGCTHKHPHKHSH
ncbi:hypothetical protein K493DRAFT_318311 [Basidiobolus meristosporus CBS 931.73]|uniref:Type 1 phosphatases regulator n=1 Tax=Basidiobolus meristosporus CBS 931.73 TaxID=1314790 RepID=A0A1Y1XW33_9FUNG|nr:hypothetical protein K493DRAFT_318311 [Basidiobolus meristosporus CBS 931.73]|eukprot:ORX89943.1 hypothetical protein K493DRAFT_318311 [Basidiobolus meristosporus CBS 931.73]